MISPNLFRRDVEHIMLGKLVVFLDNMRKPITAKDRISGTIPYYGANGIQDYVKDYLFDEDLVLLAEDGGHFENPNRGIAFKISGKTWVNNHAHVLRATSNIDVNYLFRVLQNLDVRSFTNGTTRAKLTKTNAKKIPIPVPKISEQQHIVKLLDTADNMLRLREQTIVKTDKMVKSVLEEALTKKNNFIEEKFLGDVCDVRDGTHESPKYLDAGLPLVTSRNLKNGVVDLSNVKFISHEDFNEINKRSKVDNSDILMPMIGTIGNPVFVDDINPKFAIKNVALIKPKKNSPSQVYIKALLESKLFIAYIKKVSRGGTQKFLGLGDIRKFPIQILHEVAENKIVSTINKINKLRKKYLLDLVKRKKLISSIQDQSFIMD